MAENGRRRPRGAFSGDVAEDRRRVPQPLVRKRIASGRGATEQPNATGDGEAALTPRFWAMVVLTGIATGLFGDLLMWILFGVQHLAFSYHSGEMQAAVERASDERRGPENGRAS